MERQEKKGKKKNEAFLSLFLNGHHVVVSGPPSWVSDTGEGLCDTGEGLCDTPGEVEAGTGASVKGGFMEKQSCEGREGWCRHSRTRRSPRLRWSLLPHPLGGLFSHPVGCSSSQE